MGDAAVGQWPPAFSDEFLDAASDLFAEHNVVVVAGPFGANRDRLAALLTGTGDAIDHWRDAEVCTRPFTALRTLLPTVEVVDTDTVTDVVARVETSLLDRIGRPTLALLDADLRDPESCEVLGVLAEADAIRLVVTTGPGGLEDRRISRGSARIDLDPLDTERIAALVEARFEARPHATVVSMLQRRSGGAYGAIQEMADAAWRAGALISRAGVLVLNPLVELPTTATTLPRRLHSGHPAHDLMLVAALVPRIDAADALAAFGADALETAERAHLVRRDGDVVVHASPVEGELLRERLTAQERVDLLDRYGDHLERTGRVPGVALELATWFGSTGRPVPADLATRAAAQANQQGRHAAAVTAARSAGDDRPTHLVLEEGYALHHLGDIEGGLALLAGIDPAQVDDDDLPEYLYWCSMLMSPEEVAARRAAALPDPGDDARAAALQLALHLPSTFVHAEDSLRRDVMALVMSGRLSTTNRATAQSVLAAWARHSGRTDHAVESARTAIDLLVDDVASFHRDFAYEQLAVSQLADADLDGLAATLALYGSQGASHGRFGRLGMALWGLLEYFRGDLAAALACAEAFLAEVPPNDPLGVLGNVQAMTAQILVHAGLPEIAADLLAASEEQTGGGRVTNDLDKRLTQACTYDLLGDPDRAIEILVGVHAVARDAGLTLYAIDAAVLCVQMDGPRRLPLLQEATAGRTDLAGTCAVWKRFGDLMAANDMQGLVGLAVELADHGARVLAAEVAQFTLDVARRASDMTPEQRDRLTRIAQPMDHRHVTR